MKDMVDLLNERIAELEAEHRDCLQTITDMQSKWEEVKAENERLATKCQNYFVECNSLEAENERFRIALQSIAKNTCCERCQEAALVAQESLRKTDTARERGRDV